ncbi:hypothetical protein OAT84_00210 [Gammaproteobacteria bacterium]|nr:hypothetical protein [Gammaproteobacteria bacterium]
MNNNPSSLDTARQYSESQKRWEEFSQLLIKDVATKIMNKASFKEVWEVLAKSRHNIAKELKHDDVERMGASRSQKSSIAEDFYFALGKPTIEAWRQVKAEVKEACRITKSDIECNAKSTERMIKNERLIITESDGGQILTYDSPGSSIKKALSERGFSTPERVSRLSVSVISAEKEPDIAMQFMAGLPVQFERFVTTSPVLDFLYYNRKNRDFIQMITNHQVLPKEVKCTLGDNFKAALKANFMYDSDDSSYLYQQLDFPQEESVEALLQCTNEKLIEYVSLQYKRGRVFLSDAAVRHALFIAKHPEATYLLEEMRIKIDGGFRGQRVFITSVDSRVLNIAFRHDDREDPKNSEVLKHIEFLYQNVCQSNTEEYCIDFMGHLSTLVHFLAHMQLIQRGNAGTLQWLMYALAAAKGVYLPKFNLESGVSFDFKAICSTLSRFKAWFATTAFESRPSLLTGVGYVSSLAISAKTDLRKIVQRREIQHQVLELSQSIKI